MLLLRSAHAEPVEVSAHPEGALLRGTGRSLIVPVDPDRVLARRLTSYARRCDQIDIVVPAGSAPEAGHGILSATWHRLPQRRRVPMAAALALAISGVPARLVEGDRP